MAIDANGNYVPDFGGMSQWGNATNNQLTNSLGGVQSGSGFGQSGFDTSTLGATAGQNDWLSRSSIFGGTDASGNQTSGWASPAIGAATGLAQSWLGFQNLGVAKDQLAFQKNAWQDQFNIQKEEYEYQKQRRDERMSNYEASLNRGSAATPNNV